MYSVFLILLNVNKNLYMSSLVTYISIHLNNLKKLLKSSLEMTQLTEQTCFVQVHPDLDFSLGKAAVRLMETKKLNILHFHER